MEKKGEFLYSLRVKKCELVSESDFAKLARQFREASGKTRTQAARELNVAPPAITYAEDYPKKSFQKLRKRMIEFYSPFKLVGPLYQLQSKDEV